MMSSFKAALSELLTIRDFIRYAVSCFNQAGLVFGHGTSTAFDDAVFLVLETLKLPVDQLEPYWDARLTTPERQSVVEMIEKRITTRKPSSYLLNKAYIQGIPFYVDERVIVPRSFIGEILSSEEGQSLVTGSGEIQRVLDLCTGSGCLALLAAHLFPQAQIDAVDISVDALAVARKNVDENGLKDRITLYQGDLFTPLKKQKYDLIITNPPYVSAEAMAKLPAEYRHEPALALAGGKDGLDIVRRILRDAPHYLISTGGLICEIGSGRELLEEEYPDLPFLWLDTHESRGEVFWLTAEQLLNR